RGELAAEGRQVHPEAPQRLRGHAVIGLDERGQDVLRVEHGTLEPLRELLGGDDGLLGLLGESIELHVVGSLCQFRGSGWSTRSRNVSAAAFALADRSVGRTTLTRTYRSPLPTP